MKFRTDFVTNSSDSSFITFNIKNKKLFEALTKLGIQFSDVSDGEFSDEMTIELPSGDTAGINCDENGFLPFLLRAKSISAWLVCTILWGNDSVDDINEELIELFNSADFVHNDDVDLILSDFEETFGEMDGSIEDATIEYACGVEGEIEVCAYTEVKDGKKMSVCYSAADGIETEDCDGLEFAVTGKLKYFENREQIVEYIESASGSVTESVSKNTDYLICNDTKSNSPEMEKAKGLGIAVLSEAAFIRRFADPDKFDDFISEYELPSKAFGLAYRALDLPYGYDGGTLDFVVDNGTSPIVMEVWKGGKWVSRASDSKSRS